MTASLSSPTRSSGRPSGRKRSESPDARRRRTAIRGEPAERQAIRRGYFDGTERDSVLGTYSITEEGETTLDAPLAAYRVEDGEVLPAR